MNGFFEIPAMNISEFDLKAAELLRDFLLQKHIKIFWNRAKWAGEFAKLREIDAAPTKLITKNLRFYIENFRGEFIPLVFSASGFRKKFAQIDAARHRAPVAIEKIKITDAARQIQSAAGYLIWGNPEQQKTEPAFIQITLDRYNAFLTALDRLYGRASDAADEYESEQMAAYGTVKSEIWGWPRLIKHLIAILPDAENLATGWLHAIHNWKSAPADLTAVAWFPRHPRFMNRLRADIVGYGADAELTETILDETAAA